MQSAPESSNVIPDEIEPASQSVSKDATIDAVPASRSIFGAIDIFGRDLLVGWVADLKSPQTPLSLLVLKNGNIIAEGVAALPRKDLPPELGDHFNHGFEIELANVAISDPYEIRFLVKNTDFELRLPQGWSKIHTVVETVSGDRISGWSYDSFAPDRHVQLRFYSGTTELGYTIANRARQDLQAAKIGNGDHAFLFMAPSGLTINKDDLSVHPDPGVMPIAEVTADTSVAVVSVDPPLPPRTVSQAQVRPNWRDLAEQFFDESWYKSQLREPDSITNLFSHWWNYGRHRNLSPHALFDPAYYSKQVGTDVKAKDLYLHYLHKGETSDADPHACFSAKWYSLRYPDRDEKHPWIDYLKHGASGKRAPNWLFSYTAPQGRPVRAPHLDTPLGHYLDRQEGSLLSPHALLDLALVLQHHKDIDPTSPYLSFWQAYRSRDIRTHLYFDPYYYRKQIAYRAVIIRPLADYILFGENENRRPIAFFEPAWYRTNYGPASSYESMLEEYAAVGERRFQHPCPGFDPRFYQETHNDVARSGMPPLRHFMASGQNERRETHRRFDIRWYASQIPDEQANTALEFWLSTGREDGHAPHPAVSVDFRGSASDSLEKFLTPYVEPEFVVPDVQVPLSRPVSASVVSPAVAGQAWLLDQFEREIRMPFGLSSSRLKRNEPISRISPLFNYKKSERYVRELNEKFAVSGSALPFVSVIVPTRNRSKVIGRAIASIIGQTHRNLEIIVIDDGSTDNTEELIRDYYRDDRVRYVRQHAKGVSGARNEGLRQARADYIAYLDSDNYWEPDCVELVLKAMLLSGAHAAYSALRAFNDKGDIRYRGDVFNLDAMRRENYIDMNVYVHHRVIIEKGFEFDESLKRCVDWDFISRISEVYEPIYVPIIGCNYVDDSDILERITTHELSGDFFRICQRGINLASHTSGSLAQASCRASIIWSISGEDWKSAKAGLWDIARHVSNANDELIIINNALADAETRYLEVFSEMVPNVRVIHLWRSFFTFPAANLAAGIARGKLLLFWRSAVSFYTTSIEDLILEHGRIGAVVVSPVIVDQEGIAAGEFAHLTTTSYLLQPLLMGQRNLPREGTLCGIVAVHAPVLISRDYFIAAGSFSMTFAGYYGLADFCLKALLADPAATAIALSVRLTALVPLQPSLRQAEFLKEAASLREQWAGRLLVHPTPPEGFAIDGGALGKGINRDWMLFPSPASSSRLVMPHVTHSYTFVIRCPAPKGADRDSWGDYHYAQAMAASFEEFGHHAVIQLRDDWNKFSAPGDIVIHIRGIVDVQPVPGCLNLMWVISHPDKIQLQELGAMKEIFVAGPELKGRLRQNYGIDSHVLLQAADQTKFCGDIQPQTWLRDQALFVGNSRLQLRSVVLDAVQARIPLVVFGKDWEHFLPQSLIAGSYIPNAELANWYGSSGVVLNDHWPTMREYGIISNRIFDVVATGRPVLTDAIEGLNEIFFGAARIYSDFRDLGRSFLELSREDFGEQAKHVREHHTIRARMAELLSILGIAPR